MSAKTQRHLEIVNALKCYCRRKKVLEPEDDIKPRQLRWTMVRGEPESDLSEPVSKKV